MGCLDYIQHEATILGIILIVAIILAVACSALGISEAVFGSSELPNQIKSLGLSNNELENLKEAAPIVLGVLSRGGFVNIFTS